MYSRGKTGRCESEGDREWHTIILRIQYESIEIGSIVKEKCDDNILEVNIFLGRME